MTVHFTALRNINGNPFILKYSFIPIYLKQFIDFALLGKLLQFFNGVRVFCAKVRHNCFTDITKHAIDVKEKTVFLDKLERQMLHKI